MDLISFLCVDEKTAVKAAALRLPVFFILSLAHVTSALVSLVIKNLL